MPVAPYFLPWIIARNKRQRSAIAVLNFFAGWTGIEWLIALGGASMKGDPEPAAQPKQ
jgi:hypothetical protein